MIIRGPARADVEPDGAVLGESLRHVPKVERGAAREAVNVAVWLRRANGWITIACALLIPISSGPAGSTRSGSSR
jgi:hypothetical protein